MKAPVAVSRRTLLAGVPATILLPGVAGCQAVPAAAVALNPAAPGWLAMVAAALAATIVTDLSKEGLDATAEEWLTGYRELQSKWFEDGQRFCAEHSTAQRSESPSFLLLALGAAAIGADDICPDMDPLTDRCVVLINKGADGLLLPSWAWQTLVMFSDDMITDLEDAELERMKALLSVALAPTSSQVEANQSWAEAVSYVSYMTHVGPVDIAKVERTDHTFAGLIKIAGFPDAVGEGSVWEFTLPTVVATV